MSFYFRRDVDINMHIILVQWIHFRNRTFYSEYNLHLYYNIHLNSTA